MRDFNDASADARELATDDGQRRQIAQVTRTANRWRQFAEQDIGFVGLQPGKGALRPPKIRERKALFDEFRRESDTLQRQLEKERHDKLARAGLISVVVILLLAIVFFGVGLYMIEREIRRVRARRERERRYRETQAEFADAMQIMRDESEAHQLVKEHLERTIDGAPELATKLVDAEPATSVAAPLQRLAHRRAARCRAWLRGIAGCGAHCRVLLRLDARAADSFRSLGEAGFRWRSLDEASVMQMRQPVKRAPKGPGGSCSESRTSWRPSDTT